MEGTPVVGAIEDGISRLSTFGSVVALVAAGALLAWVIGLLIVLRGTEPDERSEIIMRMRTVIRLCISDGTPRLKARARHLRMRRAIQQTVAARQITKGQREIVARSSAEADVALGLHRGRFGIR
jgi:hypothetical protein